MAVTNKQVYSPSYTEEQEKWLSETYGMSYDPNSENYYGKIYNDTYDKSVQSAESTLNNSNQSMASIYGQTINNAKMTKNNAVINYDNAYKNSAIQANSEMQTMASVYGGNQSKLAQLGLTGSGYNSSLMGDIYGDYQDTKSNAYNAAQQGKMTAAQIYGNTEMNAQNQVAAGALSAQQIYGDATLQAQQARDTNINDTYQATKQEYLTKQNAYKTNYSSLEYDLSKGEADIDMAKMLLSNDQITQQQYDTFNVKLKAKNYTDINTALNTAMNMAANTTEEQSAKDTQVKAVYAQLDDLYGKGQIEESKYNDIYANDYIAAINEMTINDYETVKNSLESEKTKLGSRYAELKTKLEAKLAELQKPKETTYVEQITNEKQRRKESFIERLPKAIESLGQTLGNG